MKTKEQIEDRLNKLSHVQFGYGKEDKQIELLYYVLENYNLISWLLSEDKNEI